MSHGDSGTILYAYVCAVRHAYAIMPACKSSDYVIAAGGVGGAFSNSCNV